MVGALKKKLSGSAYALRSNAFDRAEKFIDIAPHGGWDTSTRSYTGCPPYKDARVDIEIKKGRAFKDNQSI